MKIYVFLITCLLSVPPLSISRSGQLESAPVLLGYFRVENSELKAATEIPIERIRAVKAAIETLEAGK